MGDLLRVAPAPVRAPSGMPAAAPASPTEESGSDMSSEVSVYDPAKYKGATVKQEKAHREAMDRFLSEMEVRASEAIADRRQWEEHLDRCLKQERHDLDRKRCLAQENSDFILQQIRWNSVKKNHDRKSFVASASAHEFPSFTEPDDAELRKVTKERQRQMRCDLDLQVRTNQALKTIERNKERELEYAQLVANKNELLVQERKETEAKDREKSMLCGSWDRECRMKNIWRAIDNHGNATAGSSFDLESTGGMAPAPPQQRGGQDFDTASVASSQRGFGGSRTRGPRGAAMSLEQQRKLMK